MPAAPDRRRVTSLDVARAAGVSQPTVSRALNDNPRIAEATRRRVREVAEQLGYQPDERGRALATRSTGRIGIVSAELGNPFYPALLEPMHAGLADAGYRTVLLTDPVVGDLDIAALVTGSLDGVVLTTTLASSRIPDALARFGIPFVLVNRTLDGLDADTSLADDAAGAGEVARLLVGLGHRRIGVIAGPDDASTARRRSRSFRDALAEAGVALRPDLVRSGPFTEEAGRAALAELMALPDPPTAVFCGNDVIALGALNAARERGVRVPGDVTIVGFDDIPASRWPVIDLTTVDSDLDGMARSAVELLLARIADPARPLEHRVTTTRLVLRGTHAPPVVE